MFFLNCFVKNPKYPDQKVISGEHYTSEWWQKKSGLETIQKTVVRLYALERKNIVEKVSVGELQIVRFMPTANFSENDIVAMLQSVNR